jgi:hypothetical protein
MANGGVSLVPTINFLFGNGTSDPFSLEVAAAGKKNMLQTKNKYTNDIRITSGLVAPDIVNPPACRTFFRNTTDPGIFVIPVIPGPAQDQDSAHVSFPELTNKNVLLVIDRQR